MNRKKYFCEKCRREVNPSDRLIGTYWDCNRLVHKGCGGSVEER